MQWFRRVLGGILGTRSVEPEENAGDRDHIGNEREITQPQPSGRPARIAIDVEPQTLDDAIAYVRMGEPSAASDQIVWYEICTKLRHQYKTLAIDELYKLLDNISANSGTQTEEAIVASLLELGRRAPVSWTLDNKYMSSHPDGSRTFRLARHQVTINPSGAFEVVHTDGSPWIVKPSASGSVFVTPPR